MLTLQRIESGISSRRLAEQRRQKQLNESLRKESCFHAHFSIKDIVQFEPKKIIPPLHPPLPKAGQKLSMDGSIHRIQQQFEREHPLTDYMVCQSVLCETTRSKLVDWLIHLGNAVDSSINELFLAINLFDRFAMEKVITNMEFAAFACLLLAVKSEHTSPKAVIDRLCHNVGYMNHHEVHVMMNTISVVLSRTMFGSFDQLVTCASFLRLYLKVSHSDEVIRYFACYLAECLLAEYDAVINFFPSELAAAALLVARRTLANKYVGHAWNATLYNFSGHSEKELDHHCIPFLESIMVRPAAPSVVRKYAGIQHHFVSKIKIVFY